MKHNKWSFVWIILPESGWEWLESWGLDLLGSERHLSGHNLLFRLLDTHRLIEGKHQTNFHTSLTYYDMGQPCAVNVQGLCHLGSCFAILSYLNAKPLDSAEMRRGFPLIDLFPRRHSMNQADLLLVDNKLLAHAI